MQEDVRTPASAFLRSATRRDHQMVDRQFGALSIDSPAGYRAFLVAHARILPLAERHLDPGGLLPGWQGRTHALHSDLAELAVARPVELECVLPEQLLTGLAERACAGGGSMIQTAHGSTPASCSDRS